MIAALIVLCVLFFVLMLSFISEARLYRKLFDAEFAANERWAERCRDWRQRYFALESKLNQINEITNSASDDDDATDEN